VRAAAAVRRLANRASAGAAIVLVSHAAWDVRAVPGVHAMYSINIPRSVGY